MDGGEADCLYGAIDAFLCGKREETRVGDCRSFWDSRKSITREELALLTDLSQEALCAEAIACRLARDAASTQELLDALESIGLVERCIGRYTTTPATALYCWSLRENPPAG